MLRKRLQQRLKRTELQAFESVRDDSEAWIYMRSDIFFEGQALCGHLGNILQEMVE